MTFSVTLSEDAKVVAERISAACFLAPTTGIDGDLWPFLPAFVRPQDEALAGLHSEACLRALDSGTGELAALGPRVDGVAGSAQDDRELMV